MESAALQLITEATPTLAPKPHGSNQAQALSIHQEMLPAISTQNPGQGQAIQQTGAHLTDWNA